MNRCGVRLSVRPFVCLAQDQRESPPKCVAVAPKPRGGGRCASSAAFDTRPACKEDRQLVDIVKYQQLHRRYCETAGALCDRRNNATSGYLNEDGENADAVVGLDGVVEAREPRRVPVNQMQLYKTQHTSAQDTHQTTLHGHHNLLCTSKVT